MARQPSNELHEVTQKLKALHTEISDLCSISAATGLSLGVAHRGQIIHTDHFGRLDVDRNKLPNDDTIYYIASLTKAITASAVAILVERNELSWDTRIQEILPDFDRKDDVGRDANIEDVLSHRTGLTGANAYWIQRNQKFYMPKGETVRTANSLKSVKPFRNSFHYNNWGYGLVTEIIEKVTGQAYGAFVKENIFDKLGMTRSTIGKPPSFDDNVACAHAVKDNGKSSKIPLPPETDVTGLAGAGGAKSTVKDLLHMYIALMAAYKCENESGRTSTPYSPFVQVSRLFEPYAKIGSGSIEDEAYTLGWVRARLPLRLGRIGMNELYLGGMDKMPVIGKQTPGKIVYHHNGNLVGMLSSVHIIPETETAIIVMSNSLSFTDAADWVGQLILEVVLGVEERQDYVKLSSRTRKGFNAMYPNLIDKLAEGKTNIPPTKPLAAYTGMYHNSLRNFFLKVTEHDGKLQMVSQNFTEAAYQLQPYDGDIFYWPADREDEMCRHSMFPWVWPGVHLVRFLKNEVDDVDRLSWLHDPAQGPESFTKASGEEFSEYYSKGSFEEMGNIMNPLKIQNVPFARQVALSPNLVA